MPDEDEDGLVETILAFISGAAIGYGLYKLFSGGKEHFKCPHCHNTFQGKPASCPYCGTRFRW